MPKLRLRLTEQAHEAIMSERAGGRETFRTYTTAQGLVRNSIDALAEELRAHARAVIAPYKVPHQIEFMAELPKTANGKILRRLLRERG